MNKKNLIITGFALVLATSVILAAGRTDRSKISDLPPAEASPQQPRARQLAQADTRAPLISLESASPVIPDQIVRIPLEINESDLILERDELPGLLLEAEAGDELAASFARLDEALRTLQEISVEAQKAVTELERKSKR